MSWATLTLVGATPTPLSRSEFPVRRRLAAATAAAAAVAVARPGRRLALETANAPVVLVLPDEAATPLVAAIEWSPFFLSLDFWPRPPCDWPENFRGAIAKSTPTSSPFSPSLPVWDCLDDTANQLSATTTTSFVAVCARATASKCTLV